MWNEIVITLVITLIGAIVTYFIVPLLQSASKNLIAKAENSKATALTGIIDSVTQIAENVVLSLEAEVVSAMRQEGTLEAGIDALKVKAIDMWKNDVPDAMLETIKANVGNIDSFANNLIQTVLSKAKWEGLINTDTKIKVVVE